MSTRILGGHCIDVLAREPERSYHLVVTSPPYLWLRSYSTEPQVWANPDGTTPPCIGGTDLRTREAIDGHEWGDYRRVWDNRYAAAMAQGLQGQEKGGTVNPDRSTTGAFCRRCGAWRGELGSEPTVELYLDHLVAVFRAVKRVLRDDGTCWINLAGSYVSNPGGQNGTSGNVSAKAISANGQAGRQDRTGTLPRGGWLKPLDYLDVPGLFARAMQEDGWLWRADIALVKKAPMPESVSGTRYERCRVKVAGQEPRGSGLGTINGRQEGMKSAHFDGRTAGAEWQDCPGCPRCEPNEGYVLRRGNGRPTRAWERFLVFAKKGGYYFDSEGVREPNGQGEWGDKYIRQVERQRQRDKGAITSGMQSPAAGVQRFGTTTQSRYLNPAGRNLRNWQFWPTKGAATTEAHYAAYPPDLAGLAVKAGTSERCCAVCAAPWARVVESGASVEGRRYSEDTGRRQPGNTPPRGGGDLTPLPSQTHGWRPTCAHRDAPWVPARCLDIFGGSGSTAIAADRLGRDCTLIDLNPSYTGIAVKRITQDAPLFADVTLEEAAGGD